MTNVNVAPAPPAGETVDCVTPVVLVSAVNVPLPAGCDVSETVATEP